MDQEMVPKGSFMLLLQTIVTGQQQTDKKLDAALERMATKEDIQRLMDGQTKFANQIEMDKLTERVKDLESNRLPKWFWTAATILVMVVAPLIGAVVGHFWK